MSLLAQLDQKIAANGGLIVSCQPVPDSPLDKPEIVAAMALAAEQAGAVAIRIEGVANLQATRAVVSVPIIGIVKRDLEDSPVRITAYIEDVDALAQAGADIIAIDGTDRPRPVPVETLLARIHHHGLLAMTDCSTPEDGLACQKLGAEIIGTTLSGYTTPETPEEPDLALVKTLSDAGCRVIAEVSFHMVDAVKKAVTIVKANGGVISFDPNIRKEMLDIPEMRDALHFVLELTDIYMPSEGEVLLLSPHSTPERAIAGFLEEGVKEVIVKRGNQGASYYSANEQFHVESYPVEEVDPTGAGDCFGGAWIACRQLGFDAHRALQYANACGALAVTRRGPMEGTSRLAEIEAFIQRHDMSIREAAQ
ncbi:putative N-acetylmannosamine-6-phosphate 2-epimerase [Escherichia coli]